MDCIEAAVGTNNRKGYSLMNLHAIKLAYEGALQMPDNTQNQSQSSVWLIPLVRDIVSIGAVIACVTFAVMQDRRVSRLEYQDTQRDAIQVKLEAFLDKEKEKAEKTKAKEDATTTRMKNIEDVLTEILYELKVAPARRDRLVKKLMPAYNGANTLLAKPSFRVEKINQEK